MDAIAERFRLKETMSDIGTVLAVRGSETSVGLPDSNWHEMDNTRATVGTLLGVRCGKTVAVGVVTEVSVQTLPIARERGYTVTADLDLVGEIRPDEQGNDRFFRGITNYPAIGDPALVVGGEELKLIYDLAGADTIDVGLLQQNDGLAAHIDVDEMLNKHFAVLGTTGVGKSTGVSIIIQEILKARPDLRIFLVDPHNEYGRCFGDRAQVLTPANLRLPFWLFNFEEITDVIFRGRPGAAEEIEALAELVPIARKLYGQTRESSTIRRSDAKGSSYSVDTPVPYRMADLLALIEDRMGRLEHRSSRIVYSRLLARLESVLNDPRYAFMFDGANVGGDTMSTVLSQLFRLPTEGRPMTIMQLAGFPTEVIDCVVSVLGRMAFDFGLWSDGSLPLLFVCEEAHRYASADRNIGFGPTRRAISRIAKEGRKYGVFLGLVTQRPAELDATVISQCSTLFAMRMSNERDQALVRSAISDAAANLLGFLPSLGTGEVFAFGEGVALPTRLRFRHVPATERPKSEAVSDSCSDFGSKVGLDFIDVVVDRWRGATLNARVKSDTPGPLGASAGLAEASMAQAPNRRRLQRRLDDRDST